MYDFTKLHLRFSLGGFAGAVEAVERASGFFRPMRPRNHCDALPILVSESEEEEQVGLEVSFPAERGSKRIDFLCESKMLKESLMFIYIYINTEKVDGPNCEGKKKLLWIARADHAG